MVYFSGGNSRNLLEIIPRRRGAQRIHALSSSPLLGAAPSFLSKKSGNLLSWESACTSTFTASSLLEHKYKKIVKKRQTTLPKQAFLVLLLAGREQTTCPMDESLRHHSARRPWHAMRMSMAPEEGLFTELSLLPLSWMAFGKAVVILRTP